MSTCNCHFEHKEKEKPPIIGCGGAAHIPEAAVLEPCLCGEKYHRCTRECCNADGCCKRYPCCARDPFWPEFSHPRCLCCEDLYNQD